MQKAMWFAGMRGAVAFALALQFPGERQGLIVSSTLATVVFTTVFFGFTTLPFLKSVGMTHSNVQGDERNVNKTNACRKLHAYWYVFNRQVMQPLFGDPARAPGREFLTVESASAGRERDTVHGRSSSRFEFDDDLSVGSDAAQAVSEYGADSWVDEKIRSDDGRERDARDAEQSSTRRARERTRALSRMDFSEAMPPSLLSAGASEHRASSSDLMSIEELRDTNALGDADPAVEQPTLSPGSVNGSIAHVSRVLDVLPEEDFAGSEHGVSSMRMLTAARNGGDSSISHRPKPRRRSAARDQRHRLHRRRSSSLPHQSPDASGMRKLPAYQYVVELGLRNLEAAARASIPPPTASHDTADYVVPPLMDADLAQRFNAAWHRSFPNLGARADASVSASATSSSWIRVPQFSRWSGSQTSESNPFVSGTRSPRTRTPLLLSTPVSPAVPHLSLAPALTPVHPPSASSARAVLLTRRSSRFASDDMLCQPSALMPVTAISDPRSESQAANSTNAAYRTSGAGFFESSGVVARSALPVPSRSIMGSMGRDAAMPTLLHELPFYDPVTPARFSNGLPHTVLAESLAGRYGAGRPRGASRSRPHGHTPM